MEQRIVQVDAFADRPFSGNPAAICVLDGPADPAWMQAVAQEMNLSETAYVSPEPESSEPHVFRLRWFTPTTEVDLCGHATLAAAHVLWEDEHLPSDQPAQFETRSGRLTVRRDGDLIAMDFPAEPVAECPEPDGLLAALGTPVRFLGRNRMDLLIELDSEASVRSLVPDIGRLAQVPCRGLIVTGPAQTEGIDFVSRFFAPRLGINEDPVCGSAHCALGPYWADRLGKAEVVGFQVSSRGGRVRCRTESDRVELAGPAVTVLRGALVEAKTAEPTNR